jgi:chitodextrinase
MYKDIYGNCGTFPDDTPPTTPVIISALPQSDNSLILNWEPSTDNQAISTYELFRNGVSVGVFHHDILSYHFFNLTIGQTYKFTLVARDIAGNVSDLSNEMTVTFQLPQDCSNITYLSDLNWVSINADGPDYVKKDISYDNNPLRISNTTYARGLSMHANSEAVFDILPNTKRFKAVIGIDDEMTQSTCGSVVFKVYLDNVLTYESPTLYTNSNGVLIDLNVEGHSQIKLESNIGQDNFYCDHGNFADAKFLDCITDIIAPSIPTNISVSTNNSDLILTWSPSTDNVAVTEYKVFLNGVLYATLPATQTTVTLTGMANQTIKDLHIQAYDYAGNISSSGSIKKCVEVLTTTETYFSNQNYNVSVNGILNSTSTIEPNARVNFTASKAIILNPGFKVDSGGVFQTFIVGCTN